MGIAHTHTEDRRRIAAKLVAMALTFAPALLHLPLATCTCSSPPSSSAASRPGLVSLSLASRTTGITQRSGRRNFTIGRAGVAVRGMAADGGEAQTSSKVEDKLGVRIERNPSESRLSELGIRSWPKYDSPSPLLDNPESPCSSCIEQDADRIPHNLLS